MHCYAFLWCGLRDRGAAQLAVAMAENNAIATINLDHNDISEAGGKALAAVLGHTNKRPGKRDTDPCRAR
eukprot:1192697-Prorocentrum_minimum.AAC.3